MTRYDVAVIGAGPAGSAAAIELARAGASVLLLEKSAFPRHKVCGEFLSPEVAEVLDQLGCGRLLDEAPQMHEARVHTLSKRVLDFPLPSAAFGLSRRSLDDGLARTAQSLGATFMDQTCVSAIDGEELTTRDGRRFSARLVIPAKGRSPKGKPRREYFGFKAHFIGVCPPRVDLHFLPGGYLGVSPVEKGRTNVCALVEKKLVPQAAEIARQILGDSFQQEWPFLYTSPLDPGWRGVQGLSAGDATAFLDPFTGDGISLALRSGRLAAQSALKLLSGSDPTRVAAGYVDALQRMCRGQFAAARILRFGAHRTWLEAPVSRVLSWSPWLRRSVFQITRGKVAESGRSGRQ